VRFRAAQLEAAHHRRRWSLHRATVAERAPAVVQRLSYFCWRAATENARALRSGPAAGAGRAR
jgi:hypothetical protein